MLDPIGDQLAKPYPLRFLFCNAELTAFGIAIISFGLLASFDGDYLVQTIYLELVKTGGGSDL